MPLQFQEYMYLTYYSLLYCEILQTTSAVQKLAESGM
jgi:hypothetical protein